MPDLTAALARHMFEHEAADYTTDRALIAATWAADLDLQGAWLARAARAIAFIDSAREKAFVDGVTLYLDRLESTNPPPKVQTVVDQMCAKGPERCCPGAGTMAHVRGCANHPEPA